jgi:hypothetical protein
MTKPERITMTTTHIPGRYQAMLYIRTLEIFVASKYANKWILKVQKDSTHMCAGVFSQFLDLKYQTCFRIKQCVC